MFLFLMIDLILLDVSIKTELHMTDESSIYIYENHFNYLKCAFESLYDYLPNFCASKYHL